MIQQAAKALWAINEIVPQFKVTAPNSNQLVITSNLGGPLFVEKNEYDNILLYNEGGHDLMVHTDINEIVIEACRILYHDWLVARLEANSELTRDVECARDSD
jgi:hypothetical protein